MLNELNSTWTAMVFEYEPHGRTGTMLLRPNEELVETLEDNQVQLQTLMTSKYIAHFLQEVSSWQQKLSTADSVISIWFQVQRTWTHLESIFIGSEDIRSQLPEQSKHFDDIDTEFKVFKYYKSSVCLSNLTYLVAIPHAFFLTLKEIMEEAVKTTNVVQCTNRKGLLEKLEHLEAGYFNFLSNC